MDGYHGDFWLWNMFERDEDGKPIIPAEMFDIVGKKLDEAGFPYPGTAEGAVRGTASGLADAGRGMAGAIGGLLGGAYGYVEGGEDGRVAQMRHRAGQLSDTLERTVPRVETEGAGEAVTSSLVQYVPATLAGASTTRAAPWLGALLSDMAVTPNDQKPLTGHLVDNVTVNGDPASWPEGEYEMPLLNRAVGGVEGATLGALADHVVSGGGRFLRDTADHFNPQMRRRAQGYIDEVRAGRAHPDGPVEPVPGLDMSEAARMRRADEQGFTIEAYHGTGARGIDHFDRSRQGSWTQGAEISRDHDQVYLTDQYEVADSYRGPDPALREAAELAATQGDDHAARYLRTQARRAEDEHAYYDRGGEVMPMRIRSRSPLVHDNQGRDYDADLWRQLVEQARRDGHDMVHIRNVDRDPVGSADQYIVLDRRNIRHRDAQFDPNAHPDETRIYKTNRDRKFR